jgi:hypothetical protein
MTEAHGGRLEFECDIDRYGFNLIVYGNWETFRHPILQARQHAFYKT